MSRFAVVVAALICTASIQAQEPVWQADMTAPDGGFGIYNNNETVTVAMIEDDGRPVLRAEAPGQRALEGPQIVTAPVLPGGRRATIRTEVRGAGDLWLIANSRNGWLYSRQTAALSDRWQTLELTKPLAIADDRMTIALLTREAAPMTLEVRSLEVFIEPEPHATDVPVPPVRIEAEDLAALPRYVAELEGASGGAVATGTEHALLTGVPVPHTARPIHIFGRARVPAADSYWGVVVDTGGGAQRVSELRGEDTRDWQWIRGEPLTVAMVGDSFRLQLYGPRDATAVAQLDYIVLTTEAEPSAEQLEAARPLTLTGRPTLAAGRAAVPPVLDGRGDDACWQSAIALTGFTRVNAQVPAMHRSEMRLAWDDRNLYWWFRGEEPVLRPEMNRLHDFIQNISERDGDVWRDDAVLLVLDTGQGIFDFFVNALGTVNDSRITDPLSMWTTRDESFDADLEIATDVADGYWTIEASIGLESLGATPSEAAGWRFIAGRIEKADEETSAWNLCAPGLHDPQAFADLRFAADTPGAVVTVPEPLQPGSSEVLADLTGAEQGALLGTAVGEAGSVARTWAFGHGDGEVVAPLPVDEGQLTFRYALLDGAQLTPLLISPQYVRSVRSSTATVALQTDAPWTLRVNGERMGAGPSASAEEPLTIFLQKGVNALGLELEGPAQVRVEAGDLVITQADPWRVAPEGAADLSAAELDPRAWEIAGGDSLGPGGFRFTVLWEDTHSYPNSQPALFIAQGNAQHYTVAAKGLPGHTLEGYRCHFWLPEPLELVGVTGYYGTREEQPKYALERIGAEQIEGEAYVHYVVSTEQPIPYRETVRILELYNPFFAWREGAQPEDRDYALYFAAEALGGSIREARQQIVVRPLPPLNGRQPQRLVWQLWGGFFGNMNKAELKGLSMDTARAAGFTSVVAGDRETSEVGDAHGMQNVLSVNFEGWSINMTPWLEQHPDTALVDRSGEMSAQYVCTTALFDEAKPFMQDALRTMIAERRPDWVDWDYESSVMTSYIACFCPRCLNEFRESAGLAADLPLDAATIERDHAEAWMEFMNRRMALVALQMKEACHTAEPAVPMQIYSGYHSRDTKWRYGVDWAMIGELRACDVAACGYGRNWERIRATHEALDGIPLIVGKLMQPYDRNATEAVAPLTRAVMLRRLMDCTGGVLVYDRPPLEGRSWHASADVSRLAAAHEEVFAEGEFLMVGEIPFEQDWAGARSLGDTMIVAMMNTTGAARTLTLTLPEGYVRCAEFFTGEAAESGAEVTLELAPGDARAWVLER